MSTNKYTIASQNTAPEFGKVNVENTGTELRVDFTILMEPIGEQAEGYQTAVALDASASTRGYYGRELEGKVPHYATENYEKQGWIKEYEEDGKLVRCFAKEAYEDAINKGYFKPSQNIIQEQVQKFTRYLAGNLDVDGNTTVIYWAGGDGSQIEELGDFTEEECSQLLINGPTKMTFGSKTILNPAFNYFVKRFSDAKRAMYIFMTDGKLNDLDEVKKYTTQLAQEIAAGKRNHLKCIIIGVGDEIDEAQMLELDDLYTGTEIDIWDHKIAKEMRGLAEIFAEVVDENQIVATSAIIFDSNGKVVKKYTDGLPAKVAFTLPVNSPWFELEVADKKIRQTLIKA